VFNYNFVFLHKASHPYLLWFYMMFFPTLTFNTTKEVQEQIGRGKVLSLTLI